MQESSEPGETDQAVTAKHAQSFPFLFAYDLIHSDSVKTSKLR